MFADQAVIRVAAAAAANLTLHKTPRPPNQDSRSPERPDAKPGCKISRALLKLEKQPATHQPPKQGAREL
jgi:hypothetical protein